MALPILAKLAITLGPALFGKLFGGGDPNDKLQKMIQAILSPESIGKESDALLKQLLANPAFAKAMDAGAGAGNALQSRISANLGARGLGTSGIAAVARPLATTAASSVLGGLRSHAATTSLDMATQLARSRAAALQGQMQPPRNFTFELLSKGLASLIPNLLAGKPGQSGGVDKLLGMFGTGAGGGPGAGEIPDFFPSPQYYP